MASSWDIYPRMQLKRNSYFPLNGSWMLLSDNKEIIVPYCIESKNSNIERKVEKSETILYKKTFTLPKGFKKDLVLLHFGAVDSIARVYLNEKFLGKHEGGYTHFSFDITEYLVEGENTLLVEVEDPLDKKLYPYGKQTKKPHGMWYTEVTGIWQTVFIESVPKVFISDIDIRTTIDKAEIHVSLKTTGLKDYTKLLPGTLTLKEDGKETKVALKNHHVTLEFKNPRNWSPENPYLYHFTLNVGEDTVESYFALREISTGFVNDIPRMLLNRKPYFFHGVLDQGYHMDGIFTPSTPEKFKEDILFLKACGFNTLRKHIKIEPDIFYYYCDTLGICVFQDMVNNGKYSFLRDTALPTLGFTKNKSDKKMKRSEKEKEIFEREMIRTVHQLHHFPSIVYWTIFNEGWGQFEGSRMYDLLKKEDPTRIIDTASGWFNRVKSDVFSDHVYFKSVELKRTNKPYVLSEFGGYTYKETGHVYNEKKSYGYKTFKDKEMYEEAILMLYETDVLRLIKHGLSADIYTQLSDVEEEINGLITYDRKVVKIRKERFKEIANRMQEEING